MTVACVLRESFRESCQQQKKNESSSSVCRYVGCTFSLSLLGACIRVWMARRSVTVWPRLVVTPTANPMKKSSESSEESANNVPVEKYDHAASGLCADAGLLKSATRRSDCFRFLMACGFPVHDLRFLAFSPSLSVAPTFVRVA